MRLTDYEFAPSALRELSRIFRVSETRFGLDARKRYEALFSQAIRDLLENPTRIGTQPDDGRIHYHLKHSRTRVTGEKVRDPRHLLVVRIDGALMMVLAIVHDAMVEGAARRIQEGEES